MRPKFLKYLFVFSALWVTSCDSDSNLDNPDEKFFRKMYGTDGDQNGVDMEVLSDGSIILLGTSVSESIERTYIMKLDPKGVVLWQKKYGEPQEHAVDLEPAANGNFVIASTFINSTNTSAGRDIKLTLISADGVKLDSAINGSSISNDFATSVTSLADGGFIVTANTEEVLNGPTNTSRFRCDLNLDWVPNYESSDGSVNDYDYIVKIFEISSDTYFAFGTSDRNHAVPPLPSKLLNMQYFELDENGSPGNTDAYTGSYTVDTKTACVTRTPAEFGRNFAVLGTEYTSGAPSALRVSILRSPMAFKGNDELLNLTISTGQLTGVSISAALAAPSGYLILANQAGTLGSNILLTKIDQSANVLWSVSLGSENEEDSGSVVRELPDGKILVLGTVGVGDKQSKMALFKLNSNGRLQE